MRRRIIQTPGIAAALAAGLMLGACAEPPQTGLPAPPEVFNNPYMTPDEVLGHWHKPDLAVARTWEEHPEGEFTFTTNNLGFVSDRETATKKTRGTLRVLLTGDSHAEGAVRVEENVAAVLEARLAADGVSAEILNAGVGYYTPHHYRAVLEKFSALDPDHLIVVFFSGNDFIGALQAEQYLGRLQLPERSEAYVRTLQEAEKRGVRGPWPAGAIYQGLNQAYFFAHFPEHRDTALEATRGQLAALIEASRAQGIEFSVVLLPTKLDLEYETDGAYLDGLIKILGLSATDLESTAELTSQLKSWLEVKGVETIDLMKDFQDVPDELFWRRDYHLNHNGHRLLADVLAGVVNPAQAGE